jgi:hypothetical protein
MRYLVILMSILTKYDNCSNVCFDLALTLTANGSSMDGGRQARYEPILPFWIRA